MSIDTLLQAQFFGSLISVGIALWLELDGEPIPSSDDQ